MVGVAALVLVLRVIEACCGFGDVNDLVGLCVCVRCCSCEVYLGCGWDLLLYFVCGVQMWSALWVDRGRYGEVCCSCVDFACACVGGFV